MTSLPQLPKQSAPAVQNDGQGNLVFTLPVYRSLVNIVGSIQTQLDALQEDASAPGGPLNIIGVPGQILATQSGQNVTLSISPTYLGQTSIVTVGTITTGTWNGNAIGVAYGGTGITSYASGDLIYATNSNTLSRLADVATGNALISGGVGAAPGWGQIGLTTHVTGVLPVANGGTALSTVATGDLLYASAAGVLSRLAATTNGYVLTLTAGVPGWAPASGGGSSPLTTKGDLFGYSTTNARFPVGADGLVVTADSTAALGVSYKAPVPTTGIGSGTVGAPNLIPVLGYNNNGQVTSVTTAPASPIGLKGTVNTYAGLPASGNTNGDAYYNYADGMVYVYNGGWPASGSGIPIQTFNITQDSHQVPATANDDDFESGVIMDTTGSRRPGATGWTAFGTVTGTWGLAHGSVLYTAAASQSAMIGYTQPTSGSTWEYTCKVLSGNMATNSVMGMFIATGGASSRITNFMFNMIGTSISMIVQRMSNNTTFGANQSTRTLYASGSYPQGINVTGPFYLKVRFDGTNLIFSFSLYGIDGTWTQLYSEAMSAYMVSVTQVGLGGVATAATTPTPYLSADWFRKTA